MNDYRVLIGAYGWQHPGWQGDFYPPDLPLEWQLGFYGNEFRVVLVPPHDWPADSHAVDDWLEQSGDSPSFICEWPLPHCNAAQLEAAMPVLERFGERLLGLILPQPCADACLRQVSGLAARFRVCVTPGPAGLSPQLLHDKRIGYCWNGEGEGAILQHGQLAIARIESKDMTLKKLRQVLEQTLAAQAPERYLAVIIAGAPPSVTIMHQALTMLDML